MFVHPPWLTPSGSHSPSIQQKHHLAPIVGLTGKLPLPLRLPLTILHQTQLEGQCQVAQRGQVMFIVGLGRPATIGLHHQLIDHPSQAVKRGDIAIGPQSSKPVMPS